MSNRKDEFVIKLRIIESLIFWRDVFRNVKFVVFISCLKDCFG